MIRQIEDRILVGGRRILDSECIAIQRVAHAGGERSGEALISVLAHVGKFDSILYFVRGPDHLIEPDNSSVKRIVAVVLWDGISLAVQLEAAMRDTVRITANDGPKISGLGNVVVERVVAEHDVILLSVSIRRSQRKHNPAVV